MDERKLTTKSSSISSINHEYARAVQRKEQHRQAHKTRLLRRLVVFGIVSLVVLGFIGLNMMNQAKTLAAKEEAMNVALANLDAAEEEQEMLKSQILKLNDDEYIAKLARKEYFLSEEGEIIFAIPDPDKKKKERSKE
ncbi:FtsB family cell division protein [Paenisporosarcina cavernae]|uniref:Septum formation initiator family protein n=1 Tax=Paenisporosarcina cavernae TaxID=2320858 RepID=A0A385YYH2_9BACL|nr:septum formation initiator family protein [Paenisporosarcina cavernae]AYC30688.1 septum formation initiator family protein [Paenisporosarcina cavernae]